jgi:hypothetical protein
LAAIILVEMGIISTVCIATIKDLETAASQYGTCDVVGAVWSDSSHEIGGRCYFNQKSKQGATTVLKAMMMAAVAELQGIFTLLTMAVTLCRYMTAVETRVSLSVYYRILSLPKQHPALIPRTSFVPPCTSSFIFADLARARFVTRPIVLILSNTCLLEFIGAFPMLFPFI